jgi:hypothetical protein
VIEAELQAALNTPKENDFQDDLKRQERWDRCKRAEGVYFEGD